MSSSVLRTNFWISSPQDARTSSRRLPEVQTFDVIGDSGMPSTLEDLGHFNLSAEHPSAKAIATTRRLCRIVDQRGHADHSQHPHHRPPAEFRDAR